MGETSSQSAPAIATLVARLEGLLVPLTRSGAGDAEAKRLATARPEDLFPEARSPQAALAGLLLIAGCWDQSHQVAQDLDDPNGNYWHALAHRMEPETWNSNYWFGRVGAHAIYPQLFEQTSSIIKRSPGVELALNGHWDPLLMNAWCDRAREGIEQDLTSAVTQIHREECWLLFRWCAGSQRRTV